MNKKADAIIIGSGVMGCAIAFEMAKKGYKTLNIDKLPTAGYGSTSGSCAIVRFSYSTRPGVLLAYESSFYWKKWAEYLGTADEKGFARYINSGSVLIKSDDQDFGRMERHFKEIGIPYEEWDTETLKKKMPLYDLSRFWPPCLPDDEKFSETSSETVEGALYNSDSGYVNDPQLSCHNLQRAAEAHGAEFIYNSEVAAVRRADGRVIGVTLKDGQEIDAPIVVNAAGPHSFVINRMAGVEAGMNIRTRPLRHEVHIVPAPEGVDFEAVGCHTSDGDNGVYFRPESGNTILVGGEDPECDPKEWVEDPDNFNRKITEGPWTAYVYRLARRIPSLRIPNQPSGLAELYDVADDWIPIYDKSDLKGFYMAVGTSGNQYKNAPVVGVMMTELIEACENGHDHDKDPVEFTCKHTGLPLSPGFFSRLREINPDSSFSVNG
ncbi:FAD-binding oxidoreductase [Desulfonema ishimotonii]|uniref:FAD-binding oxidoreductase n=1 Tax=Desulfonema ishimotonii TaxID=45657 RepID=A0A401FYN5_9BACT|nr:FAD-dependent oxidoreductase [Desulfonema ishimotonii]GBC62112.1 FAD-binding oxidoreductase [Desulfonema ishimotonii]